MGKEEGAFEAWDHGWGGTSMVDGADLGCGSWTDSCEV